MVYSLLPIQLLGLLLKINQKVDILNVIQWVGLQCYLSKSLGTLSKFINLQVDLVLQGPKTLFSFGCHGFCDIFTAAGFRIIAHYQVF